MTIEDKFNEMFPGVRRLKDDRFADADKSIGRDLVQGSWDLEVDKFLKTRCVKIHTYSEEAKILDEVFDGVPYQVSPIMLKIQVKSWIDKALQAKVEKIIMGLENHPLYQRYRDNKHCGFEASVVGSEIARILEAIKSKGKE